LGGQGNEQPVNQRAERDQIADYSSLAANFREPQSQRSFEQNDGDPERYHREQQITEQPVGIEPAPVGIEPASHWAGKHAYGEQRQNSGQAQPPGQPLRADTSEQDGGKYERNVVVHTVLR